MNVGALFATFVKTVLEQAGLPASPAVVQLLVMIAAHESGGFRYVKQMGEGPARGLLQMEPVGLAEVVRYYRLRQNKFAQIKGLDQVTVDQLVFDSALAVVCARIFFMAEPEALPAADDIDALAQYAKKHWNTAAGKATANDYADAYRSHC